MTAVDNCFFCTQGLELIYHSKCNVVRVLEGKGGRKRLLIKKQRKRKIHLLGLPASNVHDKRVARTSEWPLFYHPLNTILNCYTTTLGTNYNYIRNS